MKHFIPIIAASLSLLIACNAEPEPLPDVTQDGMTVITADMEAIFDTDLRWQKGSYLGLYGSKSGINEKYYLKNAGIDKASAQFYGPKIQSTAVGYFPYDSSYSGSFSAMTVNLAPEQQYEADRDSLAQFLYYTPYAFGHQEQDRLKFEYPFGMLRVNIGIDDIKNLSLLKLSVSDSEQNIAGLGIIYSDGSLQMDASSSQTATLHCGEGVPVRKEDGSLTDFYLVLAPGTYSKMTLYLVDDMDNTTVCELVGTSIPRISAKNFKIIPVTVTSDLSGMPQTEVSFDE